MSRHLRPAALVLTTLVLFAPQQPPSPRAPTRSPSGKDNSTSTPVRPIPAPRREILGLMAEGRSNRGISRALWLSPKTVETHIRGAFTKLGIKDAPEDNRRVLAVLTYLRR